MRNQERDRSIETEMLIADDPALKFHEDEVVRRTREFLSR